MALVDAAASILDNDVTGGSAKLELAADESTKCQPKEGEGSRPQTPSLVSCSSSVLSSPARSVEGSIQLDLDSKKSTFAEQLMAILDDDKFSSVLAWMPDGKAFTIVDTKKFTKDHMPELFNIRNMSSFVRKLTRWGFTRVHEKATLNSDIFKHKEFQRGQQRRCATIKCVGKSSGSSQAASVKLQAKAAQPRPLSHPSTMIDIPALRFPNKRDAASVSPTPRVPVPLETRSSFDKSRDPLREALALKQALEHQKQMLLQGLQMPQWVQPRRESSYRIGTANVAPFLAGLY